MPLRRCRRRAAFRKASPLPIDHQVEWRIAFSLSAVGSKKFALLLGFRTFEELDRSGSQRNQVFEGSPEVSLDRPPTEWSGWNVKFSVPQESEASGLSGNSTLQPPLVLIALSGAPLH